MDEMTSTTRRWSNRYQRAIEQNETRPTSSTASSMCYADGRQSGRSHARSQAAGRQALQARITGAAQSYLSAETLRSTRTGPSSRPLQKSVPNQKGPGVHRGLCRLRLVQTGAIVDLTIRSNTMFRWNRRRIGRPTIVRGPTEANRVRQEAARRLKAPAMTMRSHVALPTVVACQRSSNICNLQMTYAASALMRRSHIPVDFRDDKYWPTH